MRFTKLFRRTTGSLPDVRWLFPITMILIAALFAFSAEMRERAAVKLQSGPSAITDSKVP
jgi:hypothetical protein